MTTAFVSGCFDPLHAGHLKFFEMASCQAEHLIVCVPTDEVIRRLKGRLPTLPCEHRRRLIEALRCVGATVMGGDMPPGRNFVSALRGLRADVMVVATDDREGEFKKALCRELGMQYVVLDKTLPFPGAQVVSSTVARRRAGVPAQVPLRVDFAGGWLDVPKLARADGFIVNCTITPMVSVDHWPYDRRAGLGGSAAWALLNGNDSLESELAGGAGWQDAAVILETGLCCWYSGQRPGLAWKRDPSELEGRLALWWTGEQHDTPSLVDRPRDYDRIARAGEIARNGSLAQAIRESYQAQLDEGMPPLPEGGVARKYCGSGWGGYAVYLFERPDGRDNFVRTHGAIAVEPHIRSWL